MLKLFLNTTDKFLCQNVKMVFQKTEKEYAQYHSKDQLIQELEKFKENPLSCTFNGTSSFEKNVKIKIKLILGFFFVVLPLSIFSFFSYMTHIDITVAFYLTLLIAYLVASRMEAIASRYVHLRELELQHTSSS